MSTNMKEYIGARYVPIIGRKDEESVLWDDSKPYESLTIVLYQGNSYTSRKAVPSGISIFNEEYWAPTGNYNAQIEQYRNDIVRYRESVDVVDDKVDKEIQDRKDADTALQTTIEAEIDSLGAIIPNSAFSSTDTVKDYIDDETAARQNATSYLQGEIDDINAFLPVNFDSLSRIADYVIEQASGSTIGTNTSGSCQWIWRKWNSGISEIWGYHWETANCNQAWGELFENYSVMSETFPDGIFNQMPVYCNISFHGIWTVSIMNGGYLDKNKTNDYKFIRATEGEIQGYVMIHAIGTWK